MKTHTKKKQTNKNKKKKGTLFLCVLLMFRYTYYSCFFFSISSAVFPATLSFFFFITFCRSVLHTSGALLCETCYLFFFFLLESMHMICVFFFFYTPRTACRPSCCWLFTSAWVNGWRPLSLFFLLFYFHLPFLGSECVFAISLHTVFTLHMYIYVCSPFCLFLRLESVFVSSYGAH